MRNLCSLPAPDWNGTLFSFNFLLSCWWIFVLFIYSAKNQTQCLTHARQVLFHRATTPALASSSLEHNCGALFMFVSVWDILFDNSIISCKVKSELEKSFLVVVVQQISVLVCLWKHKDIGTAVLKFFLLFAIFCNLSVLCLHILPL